MPTLSIPPLLRCNEAGSFAEDTILRRLPELVLRVIAENSFDEHTNQRLRDLSGDLPTGRIRPLQDELAPDGPDWQNAIRPYLGQTWRELPFIVAEMIFYRRVLEATGYFQPGPGKGLDPYRLQKKLGLDQAGAMMAQALPQGIPSEGEPLQRLLHMSLWANQADLSLWPVQGDGGGKAQGGGSEAHLLCDQSGAALQLLEPRDGGRVEWLLDNFGAEFIFDLLLADALLARDDRLSIRLHVKPHPCFVSDVIAADIPQALAWLQTGAPLWARPAAERLLQAQRQGRLSAATHFYWASPSPAWEMPPEVRADLAGSRWMISKGDVNYRRWLGDARWPHDTPLENIIDPPAPLSLLRVSKSDLMAGLRPGQAEEMFRRDPAWLTNGQWGVIQFVK